MIHKRFFLENFENKTTSSNSYVFNKLKTYNNKTASLFEFSTITDECVHTVERILRENNWLLTSGEHKTFKILSI